VDSAPPPQAHLGHGDRARAHNTVVPLGLQRRWFAHTVAQFGSSELKGRGVWRRSCPAITGCVWATPSLKVAPTSPRARRVRWRDGDGWIINGFQDVSHPTRTNAQYVFLVTNHGSGGAEAPEPDHVFWFRWVHPAWRSSPSAPSTATAPTSPTTAMCASTTSTEWVRSTAAGRLLAGGAQRRARHGPAGRSWPAETRRDVPSISRCWPRRSTGVAAVAPRDDEIREVPPGPQHRPDGGGDEHPGDVRPGRDSRRRCANVHFPTLMDILGTRVEPAARKPTKAADDGGAEYVFRLAVPTGNLRWHPRGVPQHDRPARAWTRAAETTLRTSGRPRAGRSPPTRGVREFRRSPGHG